MPWQRAGRGDAAVSPVIAVILMVAITVVLSATVYIWVTGFGDQTERAMHASFAARAVDLPSFAAGPGADADQTADALEITYAAGGADLAAGDLKIVVDGVTLVGQTAGSHGFLDTAPPGYCTTLPGASVMASGFTWVRGESLFLWRTDDADCTGAGDLQGWHLVKVVARNLVVLDTVIEVHDPLA
jgi:flagellin-like protein